MSLHHDPSFQALPPDLQAQVKVALTLGAQLAAIRKLTDGIQKALRLAAPQFSAYGEALDHHVRLMEAYHTNAVDEAYGLGWRRG